MKRLAVVGSLLFLAGVGYVRYMVARLPDVSYLKKTNPTVTALMEQRPREKRRKPQTIRTWVSLKVYDPQLRERLKQAGEYCGIQLCECRYASSAFLRCI
jgi:methyl coenzyme M reductase subunit C-like uncharacterized protein (methanogenesis marker protein 7)